MEPAGSGDSHGAGAPLVVLLLREPPLMCAVSQDLGLHRKLGSESKINTEADHTELRRRVWGGCVIADRWCAAMVSCLSPAEAGRCD